MHLEKFDLQACPAMINHYVRGSEGALNRENINREKTCLNFEIGDRFSYDDIKTEIEKSKKSTGRTVRKDAITMENIVVTMPKNVPREDTRQFFQACYDSLKRQLIANGLEPHSKMCGYVHMDETTPHMHLSFIPTKINEKGKYVFSAKTLTGRSFLQKMHKETENYCTQVLGYIPSLLIADDNLNSILSRFSVSQKQYTKIQDRMKNDVKKDLANDLEKYKEVKETYKQEINDLEAKINKMEANRDKFIKDFEIEKSKLENEKEELLAEKKVLEQKAKYCDDIWKCRMLTLKTWINY